MNVFMKLHLAIYCRNVRLIYTQKDIFSCPASDGTLSIWYSVRAYVIYVAEILQKFISRSADSASNPLKLISTSRICKETSVLSASRIGIWIFFTCYYSSVINVF